MRRSRQFRPLALSALEERVVLSHLALPAHHHSAPAATSTTTTPPKAQVLVQPGPKNQQATPGNLIEGNVGNFNGQSIAQTIAAGKPVFEELTTYFQDPSAKTITAANTQTETRLITPDKADNTITTVRNINLRNSIGFQKITDVAVTTGATTNHTITTIDPGGAMSSEYETMLVQGNKTLMKGTIVLNGGSVETFTGTITTSGNKTTTDETRLDPQGYATRTDTVVTVHNELSQSTVTTTTYPDGTSTVTKSNTYVLRLQPPAS